MKKVSVIVPCYNETIVIKRFYEEVSRVIDGCKDYNFELIFVDDGSTDETLVKICRLAKEDERIKYISFSRNFGKEGAMLAGLEYSTGDIVGIMDADLQHSPDMIPDMIKAVDEEGYDVAAAKRTDRKDGKNSVATLSYLFYKIANKISEVKIDDGAQDFRFMTRKVVDAILSMPEYTRFTKGIFSWVGFSVKWFAHEDAERIAGKSKWSVMSLLKYAIDGIVGYTNTPLKFPVIAGALSVFIGFLYFLNLFIKGCYGIPGEYRWVIDIMLFVGGLIMISIGIGCEYIARIYGEVKGRPKYIVSKTNFGEQAAEPVDENEIGKSEQENINNKQEI